MFKPGVLLQGWFIASRGDATSSTFRLRRAELSVKGEIIPDFIEYRLMADFAKVLEAPSTRAISALQDVFITFKSEWVEVSLGQFKIPVSWEGYNSSGRLLFPERDIVSTTYGDRRDLGVRLSRTFKYFGYSLGLFNGSGLNVLDGNNNKDVGARAELYPIAGMTIAGVAYGTVGKRETEGSKDRFEVDFRYETDMFLLQSEYIRGIDVGKEAARVTGHGFYAAAGVKLYDELQFVGRFGYLDPDVDRDLMPADATAKDEMWHYEACANLYILKQQAKTQLAVSRFVYDQKTAVTDVTLAVQLYF